MSPAQSNGHAHRFTLSMSEAVKDHVRVLFQAASHRGIGEEFAAAYPRILERLQTAPRSFGEPEYTLYSMRLVVYKGALAPLVVSYAVHEDQPLVFVRGFSLMS